MSVCRPVIQYDDAGNELGRFNSIQEAQELFSCTHISSVCSGRRLHEKGYVWRYATPDPPRRYRKRKSRGGF